MRKGTIILLVISLSLILVSGACAPKPEAVSPEEFYKNNTVTMIVNSSAGSGSDYAGRLFASFWAEETGGPAMPVKDMGGGGGIEGLNYIYNCEPDGTMIGVTHHCSDITLPPLLETPGPDWDTSTLSWIGFFGFDPMMFYLSVDAPYQTIADLKKEGQLVFAAAELGGNISVGGIISVFLMGLENAKIVHGYEAAEMALAAKRGEVIGYSHSASSGGVAVRQGITKPFFSLSFERTAWFPDTPAIVELVDLTPKQEDMLTFIQLAMRNGKSFYAPPGVAPDKLNYLRRAFDNIVDRKGFVKIAKKRWTEWETPLTGEQLEAETTQVLNLPPEKLEAARTLMAKYVK